MGKDLELWRFIASRLEADVPVTLLLVAESSGSSPGRAGYKMAVAAYGEMIGSIGGGVMEVNLVEVANERLNTTNTNTTLVVQVHRKHADNASGMICSGTQTVICRAMSGDDLATVRQVIKCLSGGGTQAFEISDLRFQIIGATHDNSPNFFTGTSETGFLYQEKLDFRPELYIIGGGHCALALSEIMSKLGFRITIFDDRPDLNTLAKNAFADEITLIESYEIIAEHVPEGSDVYVVVMTLGYSSDKVVMRQLIDSDMRYFGVLGSKAKMATLFKELRDEGYDADKLSRIRTPIGLAINSHTPEEIAVSIAAEIISVKNA